MVSRTLLFVLMTAVIVAVFTVAFVTVGRQVFLRNSAVAVLVGAGIAALIQPVYTWGVRAVNWLLYGDRADPYQALVRSGQAVQTHAGGSGLVEALLDSVRTAMRLSFVRIEDEARREVAASGTASGRRYQFTLLYHGAEVGQLTMARGSDLLTAGDRRLLAGVVPLLGAALDSMRREAELQAVRERLVTAHEEERRRLRRELHDGLGPTLAAVSLSIDAARSRMRRDPEAGERLLDTVQAELRESVGEMRRLIDALRPAALDQQGLITAVRHQVASLSSDLSVSVSVDGGGKLGELPAAVEVAAYRIAVEAVTNAVRHARGTRCTVVFRLGADGLEVVARDDGCGRGGRPEGVGIASMRERAEELGGVFVVEDTPVGGCLVRAVLPLGRAG
ncbi:sensor histidine kinase [Streptomyces sp. NPDC055722]